MTSFTATYTVFVEQLTDAYEHLYDVVYLRNHVLIDVLITEEILKKEKAWQLHHLLLDAIQELNPGAQAPLSSREWRRHRLMQLRYIDGLTPQAVADQLAISRRHYYRTHEGAIDAIAKVLWSRYVSTEMGTNNDLTANSSAIAANTDVVAHSTSPVSYLELIRLESSQFARVNRNSDLDSVLNGVLNLLREPMQQRGIQLENLLPDELPETSVNRELLRQLLLGLFAWLMKQMNNTALCCNGRVEKQSIRFTVSACTNAGVTQFIENAISNESDELTSLHELTILTNTRVSILINGNGNDINNGLDQIIGLSVVLPMVKEQRTVLVVDDNEDVLELFQRYLALHQFNVRLARNAQEALQFSRDIYPEVIILDLMMPDQDGWDLLQMFLNQPHTRAIPIIVCSVLKQKELALSLGATAFLQKPITEQSLLSMLNVVLTSDSDVL